MDAAKKQGNFNLGATESKLGSAGHMIYLLHSTSMAIAAFELLLDSCYYLCTIPTPR